MNDKTLYQIDAAVVDLGGGLIIELIFSTFFKNYAFKIYNIPIILISRLAVNYYFDIFNQKNDTNMWEILLYNMFLMSFIFKILNPRSSFCFLHALFLTMFLFLAQKHQYILRIKKIRQDLFAKQNAGPF